MTTRTISNACDRYANITDRQALGESISEEDDRWCREHAAFCAACKTEAALYAVLPKMVSTGGAAFVERRPRPARFAKNRVRVLLLAATLTIGGVAAADLVVGQPRVAPTLAVSPARKELAAAVGRAASKPAPTPNDEPVMRPKATPAATGKRVANVAPPDSPDDLLREARTARAAGDQMTAAATYKRLIADFPHSPQARAARLSLGDLQLGPLADPAGALASYEAYLQAGPGALTPEARYGRVRALAALGRSAEEKREAARFIKDYPGTPQANSLSARLAAP